MASALDVERRPAVNVCPDITFGGRQLRRGESHVQLGQTGGCCADIGLQPRDLAGKLAENVQFERKRFGRGAGDPALQFRQFRSREADDPRQGLPVNEAGPLGMRRDCR
jgi:hypothetical protein